MAAAKEENHFVAGTFTPAGATTVLLEHDLCPSVTVAAIVKQARSAIAWVYRHVAEYGGDDSAGWKAMSKDYFDLCRERDVPCEFFEIPNVHHFSVSASLSDPRSPLSRAMLRQMGLT